MRYIFSRQGLLLLVLLFCYQIAAANTSEEKAIELLQKTGQLSFTENKGQMKDAAGNPVAQVLYKATTPGLHIWVTNTGLTYQFLTMDKIPVLNDDGTPKVNRNGKPKTDKVTSWNRVDLVLKGASISKENTQGQNEVTQGSVNYYLSHCPDGVFNIKSYEKITIKEVYPGIDWVIYTSENGTLKYDFIVHPGADPKEIRLIYEGNGAIDIQDNKIQFTNDLGKISEGELLCYQNNAENIVSSTYNSQKNAELTYLGAGNKIIGLLRSSDAPESAVFSYELNIEIGTYDTSNDLVIDPELVWATMYGGSMAFDAKTCGALSTETDSSGNVYVCGYTNISDFPTLDAGGGAYYQGINNSGDHVCFIVKFNNVGVLLWATYYGDSTGNSSASSLDIDIFGNLWVVGTTESTALPTQAYGGAYYQAANGGSSDIMILKFDNSGNRLWATYYGGSGSEGYAEGFNYISTDILGNAWIVGITSSTDFPVDFLSGAYNQSTLAGGVDGYILKFDNLGNRLWATYYGGTGDDFLSTVHPDVFGNAWIGGETYSANFPVQSGGAFFQAANAGKLDAVILKFNSSCVRQWATYYGGAQDEKNLTIITDSKGDAWVSGRTKSANFPTDSLTGSFYQGTLAGYDDAFLLKFSNNTTRLWATYYGGTKEEHVYYQGTSHDELAVDSCDNVYFSFQTNSTDIPTLNPGCNHYYDGSYNGAPIGFLEGTDCIISKFSSDSRMLWATYVGGVGNDFRGTIAVDNNNNLFVSGEFTGYISSTASLPLLDPGGGAYFDSLPNPIVNLPDITADKSFMLKFVPVSNNTQSQVNSTNCSPCNGSAAVTVDCGFGPYSFAWSNGAQTIDTSVASDTITGLCAGNYNVTVTSSCGEPEAVFFTITGPSCTSCPGNMVNNPGFELNTGFPTNLDQLSLVTGWTNTGGAGTPDYLHTGGTYP
ncbi:MAG TPA: hypothetical protein EYN38_01275, partial [Flavobacteriales bacterium]|nr:hypothetical protein [Flavobacteriales bacterium]